MSLYRDRPPEDRFSHIARVDEQRLFAVEHLRPTQHPVPDNLHPIQESHDNGATWQPVPMRRSIGSWLYQSAHFEHTDWPPSIITQFAWEPPALRVRYVDFGHDARWGYEWDARYLPEQRVWTVRKVRIVRDGDS